MGNEEHQRASNPVITALERRILSGRLADGSPLPSERDLMQEFDISRTVAREAVQVLASRGLVEMRTRFRPKVRRPTVDTALSAVSSIVTHLLAQDGGIRSLFETHTMIEAALVRNAAQHATPQDLTALRHALEVNKNAVQDSALFHETDVAFHRVLYDISRNPVMPALHQAYIAWLAPQWSQMPRLPERNLQNVKDHTAIFDAILEGDPDTAEAALRAHLANAWDQVRNTFDNT